MGRIDNKWSARQRALDYMIKRTMIGGFALVAVPAEYKVAGVQTFTSLNSTANVTMHTLTEAQRGISEDLRVPSCLRFGNWEQILTN